MNKTSSKTKKIVSPCESPTGIPDTASLKKLKSFFAKLKTSKHKFDFYGKDAVSHVRELRK